jgi:hypothetical protein
VIIARTCFDQKSGRYHDAESSRPGQAKKILGQLGSDHSGEIPAAGAMAIRFFEKINAYTKEN